MAKIALETLDQLKENGTDEDFILVMDEYERHLHEDGERLTEAEKAYKDTQGSLELLKEALGEERMQAYWERQGNIYDR